MLYLYPDPSLGKYYLDAQQRFKVVILYEKEIPVLSVVDPQPEDISEPLTAPADPNKADLNTLPGRTFREK